MRISAILIALNLACGSLAAVAGQTPDLIEAVRRAIAPQLPKATEATPRGQMAVNTTALGCGLISGLPLPDPIEAYRFEFPLTDGAYAVHISADGSLVQACDQRYPNLGRGVQPVARDSADSDGDGLADSRDDCPQIAGVTVSELRGCPQTSSADRDGDGSLDRLDHCPDQAGAAATEGCTILKDADRDGAPDHIDICRADSGIIHPDFALGCPADGSGASSRRRASDDICRVSGTDILVYGSRDENGGAIKRVESGPVIGRTAALDWYQLTDGWVRAEGLQLTGACYNIPLVNPAVGGATGCFMRPLGDFVNVREAPAGNQVTRLLAHEQQAVLGRNANGDWLFYRAGWVSRSVLELAGTCESLPPLDPAHVASGTIHFCPPAYAGLLQPRIGIGEWNARVASATLANRLRAEPDYLTEQIGEIPPGRVIDAVLDGPACNGPWVWWQVEFDGKVGWTVESDFNAYHYYLEPVAGGATTRDRDDPTLSETAQPASKRLIHSANLDTLNTVAVLQLPAPIAVAWSPKQSALAALTEQGEIALFRPPDFASIPLDLSLPSAVSAIAFSPDENWLAAGDKDGRVTLFELRADRRSGQTHELGEQAGPIRQLAWNRTGDKLAAISGAESLRLARQAGTLKLWEFDAAAPASSELVLHYRFPYPLTAAAFSRHGRWLAVSGESSGDGRAAIWVYDSDSGDLAFSKALVPMRGGGFVLTSPSTDLGDFVYSSGDSLYQLHTTQGVDQRIHHLAGALYSGIAFRPQFIPGAEALMALAAETRSGTGQLGFANALSPHSPDATFSAAPAAIAFSPDGRLLAIAETKQDRIRLLGVTAAQ